MMISDSYVKYKKLLTDQYQPQLQYRGESVIRNLPCELRRESIAWIIWDKKEGLECCKVIKTGDSFSITQVLDVIDFSNRCCIGLDALFDSKVQTWLNLCHYEDEEGAIHYDSYYDKYPIHDDTAKYGCKVGELRSVVGGLISECFPFQHGDTVILAGNLWHSNLMKDSLQTLGCRLIRSDDDSGSNGPGTSSCESMAHINLFVIGSDSVDSVSMPTGCELAVYEVPGNQETITEPPAMKILESNSDFLGNIWMETQTADGSFESCLHSEGIVDYCEIKTN